MTTYSNPRKALWALTAITAQLLLARLHDRQLARLSGRERSEASR
ncbi:MAG: hypothetical protein ACKO9D_05605 [Gammaproteobacteria bacterium]